MKEIRISYREISLLLQKTKRGLDYSEDTALIHSPRRYSPILIIGFKWA